MNLCKAVGFRPQARVRHTVPSSAYYEHMDMTVWSIMDAELMCGHASHPILTMPFYD